MAETWSNDIDLRHLQGVARAGAIRGLQDAGEHLLERTNRIVPRDDGDLQHSGRVTVDTSQMTVAVSYDTPYAVMQHEDLGLDHAGGRQSKYLEKTMAAERDQMRELIAAQIRAALGT